MKIMDKIIVKEFSDPVRAKVQEDTVSEVQANPDKFINQYVKDERSFNGRYVASDLFKEMFEPFAASKESRNYFNAVVHNAAAVLSSEQFNRVLKDKTHPERDTVVFLTGIPGAGKTSSVLEKNEDGSFTGLPNHFKMVFEGKLDDPKTSIPKIQSVLDAGFKPVIMAVHRQPEIALENTFKRFNEEGRGASIETMASIQGKTPDGLETIYKNFGDEVQLTVRDLREAGNSKHLVGWENLDILRSEGNYETIKQTLTNRVESAFKHGEISSDCYSQAIGKAPRPIDQSLVRADGQAHQPNEHGRKLSPIGSKVVVLSDEKKSQLKEQLTQKFKQVAPVKAKSKSEPDR